MAVLHLSRRLRVKRSAIARHSPFAVTVWERAPWSASVCDDGNLGHHYEMSPFDNLLVCNRSVTY